ncbi:hypothetical protein [Rhizobium sp. LC145]|jgi:hypothetical protein|uniref:hypothetical protein n=1 Tax=Rhizobium sp. LC145 TaxID=1120688 RepID=UPI00062A2E3E|nr:hypothetical protein [Rhizobium sp. LC145]KKX26169.1 hypothetical protein YH62_24035 [Rhizobium sp. LC145]
MSEMPADLHPDRMAACFRTVGATGLPKRLTAEPRFAGRLAGVLHRHYDLTEMDEGSGAPEDQGLVALSRDELERLAVRAGVILRAREFLREIRGPVLAALAERFGPGALEDARRHVDLAGNRPPAIDLDGLEAAVSLDGEACLAAWIAALPAPLSRRVCLKWPNDHAVPSTDDAYVIERGPVILRRLASVAGLGA